MYYAWASIPMAITKIKQISKGPHRSQFFSFWIAAYLSPGIMSNVYFIFDPTLSNYLFWMRYLLPKCRRNLLRSYRHCSRKLHSLFKYQMIIIQKVVSSISSFYQVFPVIVHVLICCLNFFYHESLLRRRTLHVDSCYSELKHFYIFYFIYFF